MIKTSDQPHPDIAALTSEDGAFRLDGLLPGSYTLAAYLPDGEALTTTTALLSGRVSRVVLSARE